jgi:hypothetical protein
MRLDRHDGPFLCPGSKLHECQPGSTAPLHGVVLRFFVWAVSQRLVRSEPLGAPRGSAADGKPGFMTSHPQEPVSSEVVPSTDRVQYPKAGTR